MQVNYFYLGGGVDTPRLRVCYHWCGTMVSSTNTQRMTDLQLATYLILYCFLMRPIQQRQRLLFASEYVATGVGLWSAQQIARGALYQADGQ